MSSIPHTKLKTGAQLTVMSESAIHGQADR